MKPEAATIRLHAITRARSKMYELGVPESQHLRLADSDDPTSVLLLAVATLGDAAARLNDTRQPASLEVDPDLAFAASYFDALLESRFAPSDERDLALLSSAAYYLADRPGSSRVMAKRLLDSEAASPVEELLRWLLRGPFVEFAALSGSGDSLARRVAAEVTDHFLTGASQEVALRLARELRDLLYASRSARDLLLGDLMLAVLTKQFGVSSWALLPEFSQLPADAWSAAIGAPGFPRELWPAQVAIGRAGLLRGRSGIVQMPTSAGKTRAVELVLRAGFLSGRATLAVVVAPFRALCHEIAMNLRESFANEGVLINELSDVIQEDYLGQLAGFFGIAAPVRESQAVLVVTPEKLQYMIRQQPALPGVVDLVVYDEAHQFDSGARGITYELLLSELKEAMPASVQVIAVSAVLPNGDQVKNWLLGDDAVVVDGSGLMPTARAVAFASWLERRGQLQFQEVSNYFVPRVIETQELDEVRGQARFFPSRLDTLVATDVSLYLGLRLAPRGSVALFAGTKSTAAKMAKRAAVVFSHNTSLLPPSAASDADELARLVALSGAHFGDANWRTEAARFGLFVHDNNTPNGLRLAIEHAMQRELVRFVVCTSTLAQGVNLPIRYLIVSGTQQGDKNIRARDFQNLLGRAGRAGMHTEGLVIFGDPRTYDERMAIPRRYDIARTLLDLSNAEPVSSSLLSIVSGIQGTPGVPALSHVEVARLITASADIREAAIGENAALRTEVSRRLSLLESVESYLMAHRESAESGALLEQAASLAARTYAFSLGDDDEREALVTLFSELAKTLETAIPESQQQEAFGRTLLGADDAQVVFNWVAVHGSRLADVSDTADALSVLLPLVQELGRLSLPNGLGPSSALELIGKAWIRGDTYQAIFALARDLGVSRTWGQGRRNITEDALVGLLHQTLAYETSLVVAAVSQFLGEAGADAPVISLLAQEVKYGLGGELAVSCFEIGFADRAIARGLASTLVQAGFDGKDLYSALETHMPVIRDFVAALPSYYREVLVGLTPSE